MKVFRSVLCGSLLGLLCAVALVVLLGVSTGGRDGATGDLSESVGMVALLSPFLLLIGGVWGGIRGYKRAKGIQGSPTEDDGEYKAALKRLDGKPGA